MRVSIIIPAYNMENYISRTLQSCVCQEYSNIEIITVDDGSIDQTCKVIDTFDDPRIVKLTQPNKGVSAARNLGLRIATGDCCIFLDGDDWLEPNAIKCLVEAYEREKCFIISTYKDAYLKNNMIQLDNSGDMLGVAEHITWAGYAKSYCSYFHLQSSCYKLFDMQIIRNNGIYFDETITHGEDGLFVCQYLKYTKELYYLPKQLWVILNRPNSASRSQFNPTQLSMFCAIDQMEAISMTEADKDYFRCYRCERIYYFGWKLITSENRDPKIIERMSRMLQNNVHRFFFGKQKLRWKAKYLFMLLWYACHTHKWLIGRKGESKS